MLFNSIEYFLFLLITIFLYWSSPHSYRKFILLVASLFFYATWSIAFLFHFLAVISINYIFLFLIKEKRPKNALIIIIVLNFINLCFFKYFYFFIETILLFFYDPTLAQISPNNPDFFPTVILPLAISFYTFQIIAFHIDIHRNHIDELPSYFDYALFIMFFPQLIAGPIVRHNELLPFLNSKKNPEKIDINRAFALIGTGIVKKAFIADYLSGMVQIVTQNPAQYHSSSIILASFFFGILVYCDFSGYTDLARGSALFLGFELPTNFRGPFFQVSFQDHWTRWHLTLSTWLRDYLYISLGGSRVGDFRSYLNMVLTFFIGGLWHGAGWGFAFWGTMNGMFLAIEKWMYTDLKIFMDPLLKCKQYLDQSKIKYYSYRIIKGLFIFSLITFIGVYFNAGSDTHRGNLNILGIVSNWNVRKVFPLNTHDFFIIVVFLILHWIEYKDFSPIEKFKSISLDKSLPWIFVSSFLILVYCSWKVSEELPFVYFQF